MKKECDHTFYAPAKHLRQCSKCKIKILVFPMQSYSQEEFKKMYLIKRKTGPLIFNEWNHDD